MRGVVAGKPSRHAARTKFVFALRVATACIKPRPKLPARPGRFRKECGALWGAAGNQSFFPPNPRARRCAVMVW
jgi:hypothetical protein